MRLRVFRVLLGLLVTGCEASDTFKGSDWVLTVKQDSGFYTAELRTPTGTTLIGHSNASGIYGRPYFDFETDAGERAGIKARPVEKVTYVLERAFADKPIAVLSKSR